MGTVLLCVLSTLAFCLCGRFLIQVFGEPVRPRSNAPFLSFVVGGRSTGRALRVARGYLAFALVFMMVISAVGMVSSYIELFGRAEFGF